MIQDRIVQPNLVYRTDSDLVKDRLARNCIHVFRAKRPKTIPCPAIRLRMDHIEEYEVGVFPAWQATASHLTKIPEEYGSHFF